MSVKNANLNRRELLIMGAAASAAAAVGSAKAAKAPGPRAAKAEFDFVIAGGGHNSMVCAAYLAKAGYKCVVLEAKEVAGGNTATEELTIPGYLHEPCANTPTGLHRNLVKTELELEAKWGLEFAKQQELASVQIQGDECIPIWTRDLDRTLAGIERFSKQDAKTLRRLLLGLRPFKRARGTFSNAPIGYAPSIEEQLLRRPDGAVWVRRYRQSGATFIREHFTHPRVRTFMMYWNGMSRQPPFNFETGLNPISHLAGIMASGWQTIVGGTGALADSLVRLLEAENCPVLTGKYVTGMIIENGKCKGVETADGEVYRARQGVVSTMHPMQIVKMAPKELGEEFLQAMEEYQTTSPMALFTIHLALREPPEWQASGATWRCVEAGLLDEADEWIRHTNACLEWRVADDDVPALHVLTPSVLDPSRTPDGGHTLKVETLYPYHLAEGGPARWDEIKHEVGERLLARVRRSAPNLSGANVIGGPNVFSPLDIAGRNINNIGGSCHGGVETSSQMGEMRPVPGWASHRLPVKGLYQTGNTTHPGGGVHGGPGRNAAWVILDDMGTTIEEAIQRSRTSA